MIGMTVCSGIGAPEVSAPWIDWRYQSEIEPFPCAVLARRFPHAVNLGDMTRFKEWPDATVDVLCGGTPCQSFSVAGLRKGLDDPRGNLMLTYLAIADRYRPRWIVWENVPGVLSSNGGRDFGTFLGALGQLGYGFAYRVLDAQYTRTREFSRAVPQRRRRVFVVGHLGDWRRAAAVLFDGESLRGHPPPRREAGQVAPTVPSRSSAGGGLGTDFDCDGGLIAAEVASALDAHFGDKMGLENQHINQGAPLFVAHALRCEGFDASEDGTGRGTPLVPIAYGIQAGALRENPDSGPDGVGVQEGHAYTLEARAEVQAVAFAQNQRGELRTSDISPQLTTGGGKPGEGYPAVMTKEMRSADAYEADASSVLSTLRDAVGAEAFQQWGLGILAAFQSPEVLRDWMLGASLRGATEESRPRVDDGALPRAEGSAAGQVLRAVWEEGPDGRSPQGRGLAKQLAGEPGAALSVLPHEGASAEADVQLVRQAREGAQLLRQTLSAVQDLGRSAGGEGEPAHAAWAVRRLTPLEAERLMGFPDGWTRISYRGKAADACPDGPRYKALGNSWAVNCGQLVFDRLRMVEETCP
jgi:DNA (cytosine-5)-methyltransferase 1